MIFQGMNLGGIYQVILGRDAPYILKNWFQSGSIDGTIQKSITYRPIKYHQME